MVEPHSNPRRWFEEDELATCPSCGEKAVPRSDSKLAVCLACGAILSGADGSKTIA
jgi:ribosomal protein L37AE/L43A